MAGIRIPGVGSGLDTDAIVSQLMAIEKKPVTLLQQKSDALKTVGNAWRDLNSRLLNLQNRISDLRNTTLWDSRSATVSDDSVAKVSVTNAAAFGTHTMTTKMAQGTVWLSRRNIVDPDRALGSVGTVQINSTGANNGKTFDVAATDSLRDVVAKINGDATLGLHAEFVQVGDFFRLQVTSENGAVNDFTLSDLSGTVTQDMQIEGSGPDAGAKLQTAADYKLTIDGTTTTSATNVFTNVLPGVTVTVLKGSSSTVNLTVGRDDSKIVKAVKDFVDQYNSVVDFIDAQNTYDADKKKAGTLFGDGLAQGIQSSLDRLVTNPVRSVETKYQLLGRVGIATPKFTAGESVDRKLVFDEAKFRAALADKPTSVRDLFTINDGSDKGIAVRTEEWLKDYTKKGGLVLGRVDTTDKQIKTLKDQIDNWNNVILPMKEQRLRKQFAALDAAMTSLQNQGNWLQQQLASMTPKKQ